MIKLKLNDVVNSEHIFVKIQNLSKEKELPVSLTYKISKLIKKITPELENFYEEKLKLIKKYGKEVLNEDKPTGQYQIEDDNMQSFMSDFKELINMDVELSGVFPLSLLELESVHLSVEETMNFDKFIKPEEELEN